MGRASAILGNGYEIQGQNCVARLQGRVLWVWPHYRNFMLGIWCFSWIVSDMFKWPNGQQSRLPFRRSVIVSWEEWLFDFDIVNPLSKSNVGRGRKPNFVFGWLGVFYLLAGGWWWHGAKSCLGPAEIWPNLFGGMQDEFRISSFCCWYKWRE